MEIRIFDVGHGFCAYLIADNGNVMLFDAGHNSETGFRPSSYLANNRCNGIEYLVISNNDADHVSDLHNIYRHPALPIYSLWRNRSLSAAQLRQMKEQQGPIPPGMQALLDMMSVYTSTLSSPPSLGAIQFETFCNSYPAFEDTNNLSLVSFIHYGSLHAVFPGDLEKSGWRKLLENTQFRSHLSKVNIFVASHHGRESGHCEEVFDVCRPDVVIISDEYMQYATQETNYRQHANGVRWGDGMRYVLTTRNDGMITIKHRAGEGVTLGTAR